MRLRLPWYWPTETPKDPRLTDDDLAVYEAHLRRQVQTLLRKVWFVDQETAVFLQPEDKVALANEGIDSLVADFSDYMRTKVKPDDKPWRH